MTDAEKLARFQAIARYLLDEFDLSGKVYDVRESARADMSLLREGQSTWDHPVVVRFGEMCRELASLAGPHCSICRRHHGSEIQHACE